MVRTRFAALLLAVCAFTGQAAFAGPPASFDGSWRGPLTFLADTVIVKAGTRPQSVIYQIDICASDVRVFTVWPTGTIETKPGAFRIHTYRTNAIVFAMDSGRDKDGIWVESWTFTLTLRNPGTLLAAYARMVNNSDMPANNSKWAVQAQGELHRQKEPPSGGRHDRSAHDPRDPCKLVA